MDTLDFIVKRYKIDLSTVSSLIQIRRSRWYEMPALLKDLGFKKGVEIGVYKGRFSKALCLGNPELELTGVDAWAIYVDYRDYKVDDLCNKAFEEAKTRTEKYNIKLIKALSMDAVKMFEDESLDFVFIDANHNYEYVVADIAAWSKKVRKGGLVIGHDYFENPELNFGVVEAVNGWCSAYNIKPLFLWRDKCPSWMYVKT